MPRIARVAAPEVPPHITPRGNRRMQPFFSDEDDQLYLGLSSRPEEWPWSSARAHLQGRDDSLVKAAPLLQRVPYPWSQFLDLPVASEQLHELRKHQRTGRPLGDRAFLKSLERKLKVPILPKPPGRLPKFNDGEQNENKRENRGQN